MNRKIKRILCTLLVCSMFPVTVNAADSTEDSNTKCPITPTTRSFDADAQTPLTTLKTETNTSGGSGSNPAPTPGQTHEENSQERIEEFTKKGTIKKPYYIGLSTPAGGGLEKAVKGALGSVGKNQSTTTTYKVPAVTITPTTTLSKIPEYVTYASDPFYVKYVYSSITISAKNTTHEKTVAKDKYYHWELKGPENWIKDVSDNVLTLTFSTPGTYRLSVSPFEERTVTRSGSSTSSAYEVWPAIANRSSKTLLSVSEKIPSTTEVSVVENTKRRKEWEIVITAADIGPPIKIGIPPGTDLPPTKIEADPSLDITIVE